MSVWTVILIIAVIAAIILGVLYFVGRKMQAKQEDQRAIETREPCQMGNQAAISGAFNVLR